MWARRTLLVAKRVATQLRRDRRTLALLLVVPVAVILLLGAVLRGGQGQIRVLVATSDSVAPSVQVQADAIAAILSNSGGLTVEKTDEGSARSRLKRGQAEALFLVTAGGLRLVLEGTNPQVSEIMTRLARQQVMGLNLIRTQGPPASLPVGLQTDVEREFVRAGPELDVVDSLAPGLIPFFAYFFVFLLTAVSFLRERKQGTLERLMVTPIGRSEILTGYMLGFGGFALLQSFAVVGVAVLALRLDYFGNLLWVFLTVALVTLGAVNVGILVSTFARNELQAIQFIPIVIVPQGLLCQAFLPLDGMPFWVRALSKVMPMTYAVDVVKKVLVAGAGITDTPVWSGMAILATFAVVFLLLGAQTLRKKFL